MYFQEEEEPIQQIPIPSIPATSLFKSLIPKQSLPNRTILQPYDTQYIPYEPLMAHIHKYATIPYSTKLENVRLNHDIIYTYTEEHFKHSVDDLPNLFQHYIPYYTKHKEKYISSPYSYKKLMTFIRQIFKYYNLKYNIRKYKHSSMYDLYIPATIAKRIANAQTTD
jgi:hypothetical protein